jgi:molybdopterin-guanine dinucleotide biosynthesis protein A
VHNPYEVAVVGGPGSGKSTLVRRLAGSLGLDVAVVDQQALPARPTEPAFLDRLAYLTHDAVLVEARGPTPLARVEVLDDANLSGPFFVDQPPLAAVGPWAQAPGLPWPVPYFHRDDVGSVAAAVRAHWDGVTARRPVYGLVLTGGQSTRMGADKAALAYGAVDETRRMFDLLGEFCPRVFVSCRADQADLPGRKGLDQIHDRYLGLGPVSGLLSAFDAHPEASWLVVACDLPRVDRGVLTALLARRNPHKVATAFRGFQDFPEPLCAVYEPKARARLLQFLAAGSDCPRKMMIHSPVEVLAPLAGDRLANVNTPDERKEVLGGLGR